MDYHKIYDKFVEKARNRETLVSGMEIHRHRVVPKCLGGDNSPDNFIMVTKREHAFCHLLLAKIYPDNNGLQAIAKGMSAQYIRKGRGKPNGWVHDRVNQRDIAIIRKMAKIKIVPPRYALLR
jgi:hypothetical protein